MLTELHEARIIGDGFLRTRTERVLRERYGFTAFDRGKWLVPAGAWPTQRPRIPPTREPLCFVGSHGSHLCRSARRSVRVPELDLHFDPKPRIAHVVTTFHRGGAERIALTLAQGLLVAIDRPRRSTWPLPAHAYQARGVDDALRAVLDYGADIVHAHLLDRDELAAFHAFPLVTTVHNAAAGWPSGLSDARADLFIGCAQHVSAAIGPRARTIWNGIAPLQTGDTLVLEGRPKIVVVANERPQKRFDRWPSVLAHLPDAHVYVAGDHTGFACQRLHWLGSIDPAPLYRSADVFVSLSEYEGMSLAELEALQHGLPVVLSDCAAHRELAGLHPHVRVVDADDHAAVAGAIRDARGGTLAEDFSAAHMARRHAAHYRQLLRKRPAKHDLVLMTNNFAMGGAQSSARRLLATLAARGLRVAAVTVQEHPAHRTADLQALPVEHFIAPPAGLVSADVTIEAVLDWIAAERVLFWNVIPEHKILFADLWRTGPVYDVSPGEMYFASLARYFASPRAGHPVRSGRDFGALLSTVFVKYAAEAARVADVLGTNTRVIPNGVELPSTWQRPRGDGFVVGTLARLSPDKKLEQLLDAFVTLRRRLPDARLLIGGEAETGSHDYACALRARYPQVDWLGRVRADGDFFGRVHAFALIAEPAGCPNASLEAMAHGVPVVGTDAGGAREQIADGETGFLVPRGDSAALAQRLEELSLQPDLQRAFSLAARRRCEALFSVDAMADAYWATLSEPKTC